MIKMVNYIFSFKWLVPYTGKQSIINRVLMFTIFINFLCISSLWVYIFARDSYISKINKKKQQEYSIRMHTYDSLTRVEQFKQDALYIRHKMLLDTLESIIKYDKKRQ